MRALAGRRLAARACLALAVANARYWPAVAPPVRSGMRRWRRRAGAIPDPALRTLALAKLREEGFNAEVAATLATLAPSRHRRQAVEAIVALQLLYDYLDGVTERPLPDPLDNRERERMYRTFTGALAGGTPNTSALDTSDRPASARDYPRQLAAAAGAAIAQLPASGVIAPVAQRALERCAQAQIQLHAAAQIATAQSDAAETGAAALRSWARGEALQSELGWRELLAGAASSVLAVHALIVAAAEARTTREEATAIDAAYLSIGALITVLDSLVDYDRDMSAGEPGFIHLYEDRDLEDGGREGEPLAQILAGVARRGVAQTSVLASGAHHVMTLTGAVAYYGSAPGAGGPIARPVIACLRRELSPAILPPLAVMRVWRLARRERCTQRREAGIVRSRIGGTR